MNHYASTQYRDKAGRHFWFAEELKKRGHDVTVFCATTFLNSNEEVDTGKKKLSIKCVDDIPFVFVKTTKTLGNGLDRVKNMALFYKNLFPATKYYACQQGKPDVIIASSVHPLTMVAGIQIARKMRVSCICEVRDLWPESLFSFGKVKEKSIIGRLLIAGEHWIYKHANALIFTKEGDTDYLKEKCWTTEQGGDIDLKKCHYINNGVNLKSYQERMKKEIYSDADMNSESFCVTYAGTIRPTNNVGNLLDAAKIILQKPEYKDVQFLIFGDGYELPQLKKRVIEEKIVNVKLKGFVDRKYIPYILSNSSVNILNYSQFKYNWTRGNSSNKLFEYMASGKPIISTIHTGYSIIKRYNCGVELDEDTPENLAEEIIRFHDMSKDERKRIGENASDGAKDFDFSVLSEKLLKVVGSVMECQKQG